MALEMKIPEVAESITEVVVSKWLKNDGDFVNQDDILCELESDKATFELPAESSGILKILTKEGTTMPVGSVICTIEGTEVKPNTSTVNEIPSQITEKMEEKETQTETKKETAEIRDIVVIPFAESITEVTIGTWLKNDGDFIALDEAMCEIETDKATQEFPAEVAGTLRIVAQTGDVLKIGDLICRIEVGVGTATTKVEEKTEVKTEKVAETTSQKTETKDSYANGHPSPSASKILDEKGIETKDVNGTGIDGRITKEDALKAEKTVKVENTKATSPVNTSQTTNTGNRVQRRERLSPLRKTVARRLVAVKNETAMLTTFNEVNMKPIMDLRSKHKDKFKEKYGIGLGFMSFFVKACCIALKEFPQVNAMIDGDEIVFNDYCDISIAVSAPKGLVVPVVRNAEALGFAEIEGRIMELAGKARDNKLSIPEMEGGTFTITNGGVFGSMMSTPIINAPQSAILGMHNIVERPVAINGEVVIRPIMYVALSYDHRIIDGKESVSFLVRVKQLLEEPERLLLGV